MRNIKDVALIIDLSDIIVERFVDGQLGDEGFFFFICYYYVVFGEGYVFMKG